ncbi:exonuclease family protein [Tritrichomonas foetus]|uniref:Exonuclease family protein n=1 Tax=Tritrichomonas foetus TaxID=1144522 RepID=A0A1J4KGW4_9EUKA|nr:exonuclease family protein [Tritrichomonas foetus]|eukprot:OHT10290.1 exonuclease family protein [Tritrichomonas foetus]
MTEGEAITPEDIMNDSKFAIQTKIPTTDKVFIGPQRLNDFITFIFTKKRYPKWLKISNPQFIRYATVLMLDGLTYSIFDKYPNLLPAFSSIEGNGFPLTVEASAKAGQLISGISSFIGKIKTKKAKKTFSTYQEMVAQITDLYDNGFPLDDPPKMTGKLRCQHFKLEPLTEEDLKEYEKLPEKVENALDIIALDCEMVETEFGDECARLSVTKEDGTVVLDQYFKPLGEDIDYRTEFSGITPEKLENVTITSYEVVKALSAFADQNTIIIGHSLENDFRSMKLIHKKVIDTTILYNRDCQYPFKPPLERLYKKYIQKPFRELAGSHDSIDDARASFELVKHALKVAVHSRLEKPKIPTLFQEIKESVSQISYFAPTAEVDFFDIDPKVVCNLDDDPELRLTKSLKFITEERPTLTFIHFNELSTSENIDDATIEGILPKYNKYLEETKKSMLPNSVLLVYTGSGNPKRLSVDIKTKDPKFQHPGKDPERKEEFERCRRGICWIYSNIETSQ